MRSGFVSCVILIAMFSATADADPLPGGDDPALIAAAERWISDDDAIEAMAEIGALAAGGNVAAQFFANRVHLWDRAIYPNRMTRSELLEVFPPPENERRIRRFTPYWLSGQGIASLDARSELGQATDAATWRERAEVLIAAGFRQTVVEAFWWRTSQTPSLSAELAPFVAAIAAPDDRGIDRLWAYLIFESVRHEVFPDPDRDALWVAEPEVLLEETDFFAALAEGKWSAVRIAALWLRFQNVAENDTLEGNPAQRIVEIYDTVVFELLALDRDEIEELGDYLLTQAETLPYLRPVA